LTTVFKVRSVHQVECVGILDWWTDRTLKTVVKRGLGEAPNPRFGDIKQLVAHHDFGRAGDRIRNILDLAVSIRLALDTLDRL
jgi:hypothetical protein